MITKHKGKGRYVFSHNTGRGVWFYNDLQLELPFDPQKMVLSLVPWNGDRYNSLGKSEKEKVVKSHDGIIGNLYYRNDPVPMFLNHKYKFLDVKDIDVTYKDRDIWIQYNGHAK